MLNTEIITERTNKDPYQFDRNDAFWYYDKQIAQVKLSDGRTLSLESHGSIKISFAVDSEPLENQAAVDYAMANGLTDEDLKKISVNDCFHNNNWFAIVEVDAKGEANQSDLGTAGDYVGGLEYLMYEAVRMQLKLDSWNLEFPFAKTVEITDFAFKYFPEQYKGYSRLFITSDVWDNHLVRILPNTNEEFEKEEGMILVEWEKFGKNKNYELSIHLLYNLLENDEMENWDCKEYQDIDEILEIVGGGFGDKDTDFGITNLSKAENVNEPKGLK